MPHNEHENLLAFLHKTDLFSDLSNEELSSLIPFLKTVTYEKGEWLIHEGETGQQLFLIKKGRAEVLKSETQHPQLLGVLEPGDWVGEMAHLEKEPRSASIRAIDRVEAIILYLEELADSPTYTPIYAKISPKLSRRISQRLRQADTTLIHTLKEKVEILRRSAQASKTIIYTVILLAIFFNIVSAYNNYGGPWRETINLIFLPSSIVLFGLGAARLIYISGYPLKFYGITWDRAGKVALEAFLWTLPILALMTLLKWAAISQIDSFADKPLISFIRPDQPLNKLLILSGIYILLVPIQELIARSTMQTSFRDFFYGPNRVFYAILSSNILFEILHTANDLFLAIFSFVFGIFWGAMFEYQKSLVGVTVSHIMIGWWGIFALDLLSLAPSPAIY